TIAPAGHGLWSRAPWPVHEDLFELAPAADGPRVLVVEPDDAARDQALAELATRGLQAIASGRLTVGALAAADVVIHGAGPPGPLEGDALAVLAAGRLLITNADPAFGLLAGVDHLAAEGLAPACDLAEAVLATPSAFAAVRRF